MPVELMAVYLTGTVIGSLAGVSIAAFLNRQFKIGTVFLLIALAGFVVAVLWVLR